MLSPTCIALIAVLKDVVVAVAAATTAVVAVLGLTRWKRELTGKAEYEVARVLIRAVYKVREELANARATFVSAHEFPTDYPGPDKTTVEQEAQAWGSVFQRRWEPLQVAMQELDSATLEAEALWGVDVRTKTDALRSCVQSLFVSMESFVADKADKGRYFASDKDFGTQVRSEVFGSRKDTENVLTKKITNAVTDIDNYVRPHLRRS